MEMNCPGNFGVSWHRVRGAALSRWRRSSQSVTTTRGSRASRSDGSAATHTVYGSLLASASAVHHNSTTTLLPSSRTAMLVSGRCHSTQGPRPPQRVGRAPQTPSTMPHASRSPQPMAARIQREHEWPSAAILPERHRPVSVDPAGSRGGRAHAQHAPEKDARMAHSGRSDGTSPTIAPTAKRCVDQLNPPWVPWSAWIMAPSTFPRESMAMPRALVARNRPASRSLAGLAGADFFVALIASPAVLVLCAAVSRARRNGRISRGRFNAHMVWQAGFYGHRCGVAFWPHSPARGLPARQRFAPQHFRWMEWNAGGYTDA